jgi:putative transposase
MNVLKEVAPEIGVKTACMATSLPRSTYYRHKKPAKKTAATKRVSIRGLSAQEKEKVREQLNSTRFVDLAPREVYATLLDEGQYFCHWRTMYRILSEQSEVRERRNQKRNPKHKRPELVASGPNQLWSWDITKFHGPEKWRYYYIYSIIDVYSRFTPGWMVAEKESAKLAGQLVAKTCARQKIAPDQLTLHGDRGAPMTAKSMTQLLNELNIAKTHSRPYTPDDNPFSEAHFKTLKYRPDYPSFFESLAEARNWCRDFFAWYNFQHHHSGIELLTPAVVHFGLADQVLADRQSVLVQAYRKHPERFVNGFPQPKTLPDAVWINPPKPCTEQSRSEEKNTAATVTAEVGEAVANPELAQGYPQIPSLSSAKRIQSFQN